MDISKYQCVSVGRAPGSEGPRVTHLELLDLVMADDGRLTQANWLLSVTGLSTRWTSS